MKQVLSILLCFIAFAGFSQGNMNGNNVSSHKKYPAVTVVAPDYPAVLKDGNTYSWYRLADSVVQTANAVRRWGDYSGNGRYLSQLTAQDQPVYSASGITFDGVHSFMGTVSAAAIAQPNTIYMVVKELSAADGYFISQTTSAATPRFTTISSGATYVLAAGSFLTDTMTPNINYVIGTVMDGASSVICINNHAEKAGNGGTDAFTAGLTVGADYNGASNQRNMIVREIIVRAVADDLATRKIIVNYLNARYTVFSGTK